MLYILCIVFLVHHSLYFWLVPQFQGAQFLYHKFLRPYLISEERVIDGHFAKLKVWTRCIWFEDFLYAKYEDLLTLDKGDICGLGYCW